MDKLVMLVISWCHRANMGKVVPAAHVTLAHSAPLFFMTTTQNCRFSVNGNEIYLDLDVINLL